MYASFSRHVACIRQRQFAGEGDRWLHSGAAVFSGYGQIWCQNVTDQEARKRALADPHSPGRWRVNGAVQNSAAFQQAFGCKAGQPMVSENACRVW